MAEVEQRSDRARATLSAAVAAIDQLPLDELEPRDAAGVLVALRRSIDQLEGAFARVAVAVEASGAWQASGATSMAAWLARSTGMSFGRARAAAELGEAMADVPALGAAVRSGDLSPGAAAQVIPALPC